MDATRISIALDDVSFDVSLVHQALAALGLPVSSKETMARRAGPDTQEKVARLQAQMGIAADSRLVVDPATAMALEKLLRERNMTQPIRSFTVAGQVRRIDGSPVRQQRLLAFDLDLRGAGAYRTVSSIAEADKIGGFEFVGEAVSDGEGRYAISFFDWQYQRAERGKADLVIFAVDDGKDDPRIVGQSRLVAAGDYSRSGRADAVDILLPDTDQRVEYDRVMAALSPFLEENQVRLATIAQSADQLSFVASELELDRSLIATAAAAEMLAPGRGEPQWHELLYGIGRQDIILDALSLYRRTVDELLAAVDASVDARIINPVARDVAVKMIDAVRGLAGKQLVPDSDPNDTILPDRAHRLALLDAIATFRGTDPQEFWLKFLPEQEQFRDKPELVSRLLLAQQLVAVTAGHAPMVTLLLDSGAASADALLEVERDQWIEMADKAGIPDFVEGASPRIRTEAYADMMMSALDAAYPTKRLQILARNKALPIASVETVATFLEKATSFDIASSRVDDFAADIAVLAGDAAPAVKADLKKVQRIFQVSPTPAAMTALLEAKLHSATAIADIPRKTFLADFGERLGGETVAFAVHQRAEYMARKVELTAMHLRDYAQPQAPAFALSHSEAASAQALLGKVLPDYAALFDSPDLCECQECRSVVSPSAYFVELLRFLWRGGRNADGKSPLDMLDARRPDLKYLPLTCENSNTPIPYLDLATEVMEYYTANDSLSAYQGHDTGEATAAELRANPQNIVLQAYTVLKDAVYPFSLPYHQPLDTIRTYSDHLGVARADAMRAASPVPDARIARAIAAEALGLAEEDYKALTGEAFDAAVQAVPVHAYYGYGAASQLDAMAGVREFIARSGVGYPELVDLVSTRFLNPHQWTLNFISPLIAVSPVAAPALYAKFGQIRDGTLNATTDADIAAMLTAYNGASGADMTAGDFGDWIKAHFGELRTVITLYQPQSSCDLDTTCLRTLASIYEGGSGSGLVDADWSRIHRFIRLQRRLGWSIQETDLMLAALDQPDIAPQTILFLDAVLSLGAATRLPLNQLATLWGTIDSHGPKSLYRKLFLNKAVQRIDPAFRLDTWGHHLTDTGEFLGEHRSAVQAAFRIREEDLDAIAGVARVIDGGAQRPLDLATDTLTVGNLSTIYRHVVLATALKIKPTELALLIRLAGGTPFSLWDVQQARFGMIDPVATKAFFDLAASVRAARFKIPALDYALTGRLAPASTVGLDRAKAVLTAQGIRLAFAAIEQDHPDIVQSVSPELLTAKLALTFPAEIVSRVMAIIQGSATFETITDKNIPIVMPDDLSAKYLYIKGSGRLTATGIMTDAERVTLKGLGGGAAFAAAVDALYAAPETFLATQFGGIFTNLAEAGAILLNHPAQPTATSATERLAYVYTRFVGVLKQKLRRDAITQHIAALIGLSDAATGVLIAARVEELGHDLSTEGFSADYFSDANWTTPALPRVDATVDFDWQLGSPGAGVPADNFSARWRAYVAAPASGEYTAVVTAREADDVFRLYLDDALVLEKLTGDTNTSLEVSLQLNAAQMHRLRLDYQDGAQNAGIRLQWKRATTGLDLVPASVAYPAAILDA
ncbi:MAG: PA14 domain-containing protein, partial [Sphingobium sp.]